MLNDWAVQRLHIVAPKLLRLGRYSKRVILVAVDLAILSFALWMAFALRLGELYVPSSWELFFVLCAAPLIGVATFFQLGLYRLVTRYIGGRVVMLIPVAVGLSTLFWALIVFLTGVGIVPRSVVILYPILATASIWGVRRMAGWLLAHAGVELPERLVGSARNVVIYGAGKTGVQLVEALRNSGNYTLIGFVDPSPTVWGQYVAGLKVFRPERLPGMVQRHDVREVLLALPSAHRRERQAALRQLESPQGERAHAAGDRGPGFGPRDGQRPAPGRGGGPVGPRPRTAQSGAPGAQHQGQVGAGDGRRRVDRLRAGAADPAPRPTPPRPDGRGRAPLYYIEQEVEELLDRQRKELGGPVAVPEIVAVLGSVRDECLARNTLRA